MQSSFSVFYHAKGMNGSLKFFFSYRILKPEVKTVGFEVSFKFSELYVIGCDTANYMG